MESLLLRLAKEALEVNVEHPYPPLRTREYATETPFEVNIDLDASLGGPEEERQGHLYLTRFRWGGALRLGVAVVAGMVLGALLSQVLSG